MYEKVCKKSCKKSFLGEKINLNVNVASDIPVSVKYRKNK